MRRERGFEKHAIWILLAWGLNLLGMAALLIILTAYGTRQPAQAAVGPFAEAQGTPRPTSSPAPTLYYLPTTTLNPRSTQVVVFTPTPFSLPNGKRPGILGFSVLGRPLEVYAFGQGSKQRMIVAGIHGGYEWNTIALADQLILYLNDHPEIIPDDVRLYILRNLNPDGDARSHDEYGRTNAHGVDLNRNFPLHWAATWDRRGCFDLTLTTSGAYPASEPETRLLMNFLQANAVEALISYHSAALGIFPGGEPWDEASQKLARAIANVTTYPYPPIETGCVYTGTLADYAVSLGAAAVEIELSNHVDTDLDQNLKVLEVLLNWQRR